MTTESEELLKSIGVIGKRNFHAAYLYVLEMIGAIRNQNISEFNCVESIHRSLFWKTIRAVADNEINVDWEKKNWAVNEVLNAFPDKSKKTDGRMWLPIHFAMSIPNIDIEDIQKLLEKQPQLIHQVTGTSNVTPCHLAVIMKDPNMTLINRLKIYDPSFGARLTSHNSTALHLAAIHSNSVTVIQELIREYPPALEMKDNYQSTPLAGSTTNHSPEDYAILKTILDAAPHMASVKDKHGRFPLNRCLEDRQIKSPEKFISVLLDAFPDAVNVHDHADWLPIHEAAAYHGVAVFKLIAEANPANLYTTHTLGSVAHFAVREKRLDNLRYIHSLVPEQLLMVDRHDRTPFSYAVERNLCDPDFIEAVASLAPEAARIVERKGDNLLHMMATKLNGPKMRELIGRLISTMRLLLRLIPGGALATNNQGQTPYDHLKPDKPEHFDFCRLLLLAGAPSLHPETRQQMNYQARKGALFAFFAPRGGEHQSGRKRLDICYRIRHGAGAMEIMRQIASFL